MIVGSGIDLVEIGRIQRSMDRHGSRFLDRVYTAAEQAYCLSKRNSAESFAARFAAKEAISKAFGTGIGAQLGWQDMEIARKDSGEPYVILHGKGLELLARRGARCVHITLSHTEKHATAMAILEG